MEMILLTQSLWSYGLCILYRVKNRANYADTEDLHVRGQHYTYEIPLSRIISCQRCT